MMSGMENGRILAQKYPYYERREMAGTYMPNPHYPPADKVQVMGMFGQKTARVLEGEPPKKFKDWPQFQKGFCYVKGFR